MSEDELLAVDNTAEVRPGKGRRRQYRMRSLILLIALAAIWSGVLIDPEIGPIALYVVGAFGLALTVMAAAMGLGFLGFGIIAAGDRLVGWVRRASQWPEE
jgi:hypothetical protein